MKRTFIGLFVLLFPLGVFAQLSRGSVLMSGSIAFSTRSSSVEVGASPASYIQTIKQSNFTVSPFAGA